MSQAIRFLLATLAILILNAHGEDLKEDFKKVGRDFKTLGKDIGKNAKHATHKAVDKAKELSKRAKKKLND
jgi:hypothetical protein